MKSKKHYELIRRYEREASEAPNRFNRRLKRLLWLGYGYIAFVMLMSLALSLTLIALAWYFPHFWLIAAALIVTLITIQMIWQLFAPFESMDGIELTASQCPKLFEEIDLLREQMDVPKISRVVLTSELNASAGEYRSRFLYGTRQRFLGIGLPLFKMLNIDEMRSVIAHEIAHLARGHSRMAATVWHLRANWFKLLSGGAVWWRWFAHFYGERFEAMASVIRREHELEADRIACSSVGAEATVSSQLWIGLLSDLTEVPFQQWLELKNQEPKPPANVVSEFLKRLQQVPRREQCLALLRRVAAGETSIYESHPALKDRVVRAGFVTRDSLQETAEIMWDIIQNRPAGDAADYFLGSNFSSFLAQLDQDDQRRRELDWEALQQLNQEVQQELDAVEKEIAESRKPPSEFQLERRAQMLLQLKGTETGYDAFQKLLLQYPENPAALFFCGQYAYYQDVNPQRAEELLLKAMDSDPRYETSISFMMIEICRELEKPQEADKWQEFSFGATDALEESMRERSSVTKKDKFLPAELTPEQIKSIVDQLKSEKKVVRIWAARKQVEYYDDKPLFVFGIEVKYSSFWLYSEDYFNKVIYDLAQTTRFPDEFYLLHLHSELKVFRKKFKKLGKETACIYSRRPGD